MGWEARPRALRDRMTELVVAAIVGALVGAVAGVLGSAGLVFFSLLPLRAAVDDLEDRFEHRHLVDLRRREHAKRRNGQLELTDRPEEDERAERKRKLRDVAERMGV